MLRVGLRVACEVVGSRVCPRVGPVVIPTAYSSTSPDSSSPVPPQHGSKPNGLFKNVSTVSLCREFAFLRAMDCSVNSAFVQQRVLPLLNRDPLGMSDRLVQQVLRAFARPAVQYFC